MDLEAVTDQLGRAYRLFTKRALAAVYKVQKGDTLESIAKKYPDLIDWKDLAVFNWETDRPAEVQRALQETIGCAKLDADPGKTVLEPHPNVSGELLIPTKFSAESVVVNKRHTIRIKSALPAVAVSINTLDRWFVPGEESCDIKYELEGPAACADKVELEVYGSNYCDCSGLNQGRGQYAPLPDEPVFQQQAGNEAGERAAHEIKVDQGGGAKGPWKGDANAAKGILSVKTGGKARHLNVAFSPYTVHLRYYKDAADKKARLVLEPFWPQWDETPSKPATTPTDTGAEIKVTWSNAAAVSRAILVVTDHAGQRVHLAELPAAKLAAGAQELRWNKKYRPDARNSVFGDDYRGSAPDAPYTYGLTTIVKKPKADSLKLKWEVKAVSRLQRGLVRVTDGQERLVYQAPLAEGLLGEGKHELAWDGKYSGGVKNSKGGAELIPEDMPYRVQIQAHTGIEEPKGVALAAMHTEVRLYVNPETRAPNDLAYDPWIEKPSLALGLGPLVPGDPPADGTGPWYRYKLAEYGFHPGPVNGGAASDKEYKIALREFKRSVPADGSVAAPNFKRLALDGANDEAENAETQTAIKTIRDSDRRKPFGDPARIASNSNDPNLTTVQVDARLPDPTQEMVVWADDRQYYTASTSPAVDDAGNDFVTGTPAAVAFGLKNHRGGMSVADGKTDTDATSIARPWIPLKVELQLLGKGDKLDAVLGPPSAARRDATRSAIGPLRVDWTFDELPPELSTIDTNHANYDKQMVRSRSYVSWALDANKATHPRKDTGRSATYTNCPEAMGGIRPATPASYYEKAFGKDDLSLAPWRAAAVASTESIATVVHDHLVAGQVEKTDLFSQLMGAAGVWFNPSRIAGDGYRVRAELQFQKCPNYDFPNLGALQSRYPVRPAAHSARLRVWRRSSIRGYVSWGASSGNWPGFIDAFRGHYRGAHVYFVHEGNPAGHQFARSEFFDPTNAAHVARYKELIRRNVSKAGLQNPATMSLSNDYVWPWSGQRDAGWGDPSQEASASAQLKLSRFINGILNETWRKFRAGLLLSILRETEKSGYLRGHLLTEFVDTPPVIFEKYRCNNAHGAHQFWYVELASAHGGRKTGAACPVTPAGSCGGTLTRDGTVVGPTPLGLPAVGVNLGATWLFWKGEAANRLRIVWVHEVGHHRHLEHAGVAPGGQANLHDSEQNSRVANWAAQPCTNFDPTAGQSAADEQRWDRRCIMGYSDAWYSELGCLCGRCLLRNRGWKVTTLGFPGPAVGDP